MKTVLKAIGYWRTDQVWIPWPHPRELVTVWDAVTKEAVVEYLNSGIPIRSYLGYSYCRFPDGPPPEEMGNRDLTDGEWVWPEGLAVYVALYNVNLPPSFISHALQRNHSGFDVDPDSLRHSEYSLAEWIRWCTSVRRNRFLAFLTWLWGCA